ncbi:hypothetical protein GCM10010503_56480 [Streptomyces lucensis JCM 4490]|uniref:Integral membrane protein n=1 Tax=Streptomyces lucensis JCM 4490 TaxID=1306176 RepID=A0A918MU69_9ACTN|nr:hypothetical protein [Streptomyces lucensis]GGW71870.1 hypothetical protein GCM10010503_56480 [Streptomyces lucensis JCM 4490]
MSASAAVRSARVAVFAAMCVLLAAAGHGLAMGDLPPLWADTAGFLGVCAVVWPLGGRERSLAGIGTVMLTTQVGLHLVFDAAHRAGGPGRWPSTAVAAMPGHGHVMTAVHAHPHVHSAPHAGAAHATAAHLLAALVASWCLRRGEAALWSLLRRTGALVPGLLAWWRGAPVPGPAGLAAPVPGCPEPPRRAPLRYAVSRRGPPVAIPYSN